MTNKQFAENNTVKAARSHPVSKAVVLWFVMTVIAIILTAFYIGKVSRSDIRATVEGADSLRYGQSAVFQAEVDEQSTKIKKSTQVVWEVDGEAVKFGKFGDSDALTFEFCPSKVGESQVSVVIGRNRKIAAVKDVEVLKPLLTIIVKDAEIGYGETIPVFDYEVTGIIEQYEDDVQVELMTDFDGKSVGEFKIHAAVNTESKYDYSFTDGRLKVNPKIVKMSSAKIVKTYDGTTSADVKNILLEGVLDGDNLSVKFEECFYTDKNAGANKTIVVKDLSLYGCDAAKYKVEDNFLFGDVLPKELKIIGIKVSDKIFDGNNAASISSLGTVKGLVAADKVSVEKIEARFLSSEIGENKKVVISSVCLSGEDCENYFVKTEGEIAADIISGNWEISNEM